MTLLFILFMILFVIFLLFIALVNPIAMIVYMFKNEELSSSKKVLWLVGMLFLWPLAGLCYGAFYAEQAFFKFTSRIGLAVPVLFFVGALIATPFFIEFFQESFLKITENKKLKFDDNVMPKQISLFKENVTSLYKDIEDLSVFSAERSQITLSLMELLELHTRDNLLSAEETQSWIEKYSQREVLSANLLKAEISALKIKSGETQDAIREEK